MSFHSYDRPVLFLLAITLGAVLMFCWNAPAPMRAETEPVAPLAWQSPARLHRRFRSLAGTLYVSSEGIEFRSSQGQTFRWPFLQIKTLRLAAHRLIVTTYENRGWRLPGDRSYSFDLRQPMPPSIAAKLAELVKKPVINANPDSGNKSFATIAARHQTLTGGTNGDLHFSKEGITYITAEEKGGRSWRWADIQTLAHPDPYHFTVDGYRESFEFELKQPMSQALFDRLWDLVYGRGLQLGAR